MKKIILSLIALLSVASCVFADNISEINETFKKYTNDANSYSVNLPNYYVNNAKIIRVVNKKQGGQQSVIIPFDRYLKELKGHSTLARAVGYKNNYTNQKITKHGNDYKLSAIRIPRNDKTGLPCYFVFTKTNSGWKIKEESMTTIVQTFLSTK